MKKEIIKALIKRLKQFNQKHEELRVTFEVFVNSIAPTGYPPVIENTIIDGYLEAIKILSPEIAEEFNYFLYDKPITGGYIEREGKKYILNNFNDLEKYLIEVYGK